jgi:hypothetical protein
MKNGLNISLPLISAAILIWGCSKKETATPKEESPVYTPPTSTYEPRKSYKFEIQKEGESAKFLAIEYIAGDVASRLILAAPHGGTTQPSIMKARTADYDYGTLPTNPYNTDRSFSGTTDSRTKELTLAIADTITKITGIRPHVIINHLHRNRLDANRFKEVATQNGLYANPSWDQFHAYIDAAKATINASHSSGLFIDVHGHAHTPQRIEVGYLLTKTQLANTSLNHLAGSTSIKSMVSGTNTLDVLVKGSKSLGSLLQQHSGFVTVPSQAYPSPSHSYFTDGLYFNGGYNTSRHGSELGGSISGIQIEFNSQARTDDSTRPKHAGKVARAIKEYMEVYF